jgi:Chaperone of endosialidase/Domain of unknown function (DUF5011)
MRLDSSGHLLIGTTGGFSGTGTTGFELAGTGFGTSSLQQARFSNDNDSPYLILNKSRGASVGTYTAVNAGDFLGRLSFRGSDGSQFVEAAQISASAGTPSAGIVPGALRFWTANTSGVETEAMRINSSQQVGIGTTSPASLLTVSGNGSFGADYNLAAPTNGLIVEGKMGIGTTSPATQLSVVAPNSTDAASFYNTGNTQVRLGFSDSFLWKLGRNADGRFSLIASTNGNDNERLSISSAGNVGIGTSTPYSRLTVWGSDSASSTLSFNVVNNASTTVFAVFNGGNAQLSGTLTQSSDARLKTNIQSLDASTSLATINSLTPVAYDWLDPNKGGVRQYGFIAQQVLQVFPNLVSTTSATALTPDGTLGLNYIGLIAPLVEAVQQLSSELSSLQATVAGFADSFTSKKITASQELCIGATCVTETQLQALLSGTPTVQISAPTPPVISGTTTPPSINIQGSNPATINVGDTYTDLGAIVHDNQGHDLGYKTFLDGTLVSNIVIDTTQVATDTIDYVATDTWGNTGTSTRTIIIEAAATTASSSPSLQ